MPNENNKKIQTKKRKLTNEKSNLDILQSADEDQDTDSDVSLTTGEVMILLGSIFSISYLQRKGITAVINDLTPTQAKEIKSRSFFDFERINLSPNPLAIKLTKRILKLSRNENLENNQIKALVESNRRIENRLEQLINKSNPAIPDIVWFEGQMYSENTSIFLTGYEHDSVRIYTSSANISIFVTNESANQAEDLLTQLTLTYSYNEKENYPSSLKIYAPMPTPNSLTEKLHDYLQKTRKVNFWVAKSNISILIFDVLTNHNEFIPETATTMEIEAKQTRNTNLC